MIAFLLATCPGWGLFATPVAVIHQPGAEPTSQQRVTLRHPHGELSLLLNASDAASGLQVLDGSGQAVIPAERLFAGVIEHESDSWARVSMAGSHLDGVFAYRGLRYRISTDNEQTQVTPLAMHHQHPAALPVSAPMAGITSTAKRTPVRRQANIAVVVDSQYNDQHDGRGLEKALSIINSVDGIYRAEFGLALHIETALLYTDPATDPHRHGPDTTEQMLRRFRDYRLTQSALGDVCLVHLFTGNQNTDRRVGMAWINTACRTDGYDVSLSTNYRHDVLLAAHEIAHNLGAEHDSDTSCRELNSNIMWHVVSANTSQSFSDCTRATLEQTIERFPVVAEPSIQAAKAGRQLLVPAAAAEKQLR